jgi:threonine/homoserine/homoserine lactone efflux protein
VSLPELLIFATVYFGAVASPGPGLAAVVARGLAHGSKGAVPFIAGFVAGDLIWLTCAAAGLTLIAQTWSALFTVIRVLGCVYLVYLAWKIWNAPVAAADVEANSGDTRALPSFLGSLALTLGNPKVIVFFLSIMPLAIDMNRMSLLIYLQLMGLAFFVLTPVLMTALLLAARARRLFQSERAQRFLNRTTAGVMAGTAGMIALKS